MIRKLSYLPAGMVLLIMLYSCVGEESIDESLPLEQKIDQLLEPMVAYGNPNATIIGIIRDGERSIYSYGDSGLGNGPPLSSDIFEIGSITKTYTATLLSQFIMEGLLTLDDPIDKFLPKSVVPPTFNGQPILLRHLVTHTSDLPREIYNFDMDTRVFWSETDHEDLYAFLNDISQQAYPFDDYTQGNNLLSLGTSFRYSNVGMATLGHILELVSGQTFEQLVEERICSLLDMEDTKTFTDLTQEQKDRIPKAYDLNQYEKAWPRDMGVYASAGGLLSTLDDMLDYMEANMEDSGKLSQSMKPCQQGIYTKDEIDNFPRGIDAIGMAWFITYEGGDTIVYHNGGYNHLSYMKYNRTSSVGIVALSNTATEVGPRVIETIFNWINE